MVSEQICLEIIDALHGASTVMSKSFKALNGVTEAFSRQSEEHNALHESDLIRPLLSKYELTEIETAVRWLVLGKYIDRIELTSRGPWVYALTEKGIAVATAGRFSDDERSLFYLEEPYQIFLAHQFRPDDLALEASLRTELEVAGYTVVDGKVDGLEPLRHAILTKIKKSRFFLCLLTRRAQLNTGGHVSSVWLYQEIGAAVGIGKSPLLLVEEGMDSHYAGELQKTYEYVLFTRDHFSEVPPEVVRRFSVDLERHAIPLPSRRSTGAG